MSHTKTYEMQVTVSVTLPDDYEEFVDECDECESMNACYNAVRQQLEVHAAGDMKWLRLWTECEKPQLIEVSESR